MDSSIINQPNVYIPEDTESNLCVIGENLDGSPEYCNSNGKEYKKTLKARKEMERKVKSHKLGRSDEEYRKTFGL